MQNAKDFSDTAVVVFARTGCENADLPTDFTKVTYTNNSEDYEDFGSDRHYLELSRSEENMLDMVCDILTMSLLYTMVPVYLNLVLQRNTNRLRA